MDSVLSPGPFCLQATCSLVCFGFGGRGLVGVLSSWLPVEAPGGCWSWGIRQLHIACWEVSCKVLPPCICSGI